MTNRLTSQDAVNAVGNRYDLVLIAAARARELQDGATPLVNNGSEVYFHCTVGDRATQGWS